MPGDLDIAVRDGAFVLRVRAAPSARKAAILGVYGGALKLSVIEPPERGKANAGVAALVAAALGIAASRVEVSAGHASRDKRLRILGFPGTADELKRRLLSRA
jgi:uncharacterized protein YggU (UPF0235/DUF167 family)